MDFVFKKGIRASGLTNKLSNENWISNYVLKGDINET